MYLDPAYVYLDLDLVVIRAHVEFTRYLIVVPRPMPATPRMYLIVVYRPLPTGPLVVRCMYMVVVPRPMHSTVASRCCRHKNLITFVTHNNERAAHSLSQ